MGELIIKNSVERIERFQSLASGEFWSALLDIPEEGISVGDTLLIVSLRYVENELHTVILRSHPRVYGKTIAVQMTNSQGAAMIATSEASREHVKKIQDGVGSLELYVGKDVEVVTICEGESAPENIPLQIVQAKLMVDEELAVWTDLNQWFDFSDMDRFHQALRAHPSLVDQIFPSERAVVCMATTRRYIDYRDPWESRERNAQNKVVFLLVRDGQNVYQVFSSVETHLGASQLFPSKSEQQAHFKGMDGSTIKFEDVSYTDRLKAHDLMALHYRRFLILICGLDHRLKLFGAFYDKRTPFSFLSLEFQEQFMTFLHDSDGSGLLAAPELRPSLSEFVDRANSALQSGSRVLCAWWELISPRTAPGAAQEDRDFNSSYRGWS